MAGERARTDVLLAGKTLDGYRLEALLGHGSFGAVYRGWDTTLNRDVAIKVIDLEWVGGDMLAWLEEPRNTASFPAGVGAPTIHHADKTSLTVHNRERIFFYFVMRFLDGDSLQRKLVARRHQNRFTIEEVIHLVNDIQQALDLCQRLGRQHGDLKPSNIVYDSEGRAYVVDFGLTPHTSIAEEFSPYIRFVAGTREYASPEQFRDGFSRASDQYSLALLALEMLTGVERLAVGSTDAECIAFHQSINEQQLRQWLSPTDEQFAGVLARALHSDPAQRYPTISAFGQALVNASGARGAAQTQAPYLQLAKLPLLAPPVSTGKCLYLLRKGAVGPLLTEVALPDGGVVSERTLAPELNTVFQQSALLGNWIALRSQKPATIFYLDIETLHYRTIPLNVAKSTPFTRDQAGRLYIVTDFDRNRPAGGHTAWLLQPMGALKRVTELPQANYKARPALSGEFLYVGGRSVRGTGGFVMTIRLQGHTVVQQHTVADDISANLVSGRAIDDKHYVYAITERGTVYLLDGESAPQELASVPISHTTVKGPVAMLGHFLYIADDQSGLYRLEVAGSRRLGAFSRRNQVLPVRLQEFISRNGPFKRLVAGQRALYGLDAQGLAFAVIPQGGEKDKFYRLTNQSDRWEHLHVSAFAGEERVILVKQSGECSLFDGL